MGAVKSEKRTPGLTNPFLDFFFVAEHDDHHLARITFLAKKKANET
jgi:hypothetical protein